jgi:SAM-dependent methyltransferase
MNTQGNCQNLLYDWPEIYEYLYPETDGATPVMCRRIFERYRGARPQSILDVACGTGRDLRSLRRECTDCVGVDLLPGMIAHAQSRAPEIPFVVGDMRDFRLGRTFEVVVCFGSAILYAHSNEDLDRTFATFAEHTHEASFARGIFRSPLRGWRPLWQKLGSETSSVSTSAFSSRCW